MQLDRFWERQRISRNAASRRHETDFIASCARLREINGEKIERYNSVNLGNTVQNLATRIYRNLRSFRSKIFFLFIRNDIYESFDSCSKFLPLLCNSIKEKKKSR